MWHSVCHTGMWHSVCHTGMWHSVCHTGMWHSVCHTGMWHSVCHTSMWHSVSQNGPACDILKLKNKSWIENAIQTTKQVSSHHRCPSPHHRWYCVQWNKELTSSHNNNVPYKEQVSRIMYMLSAISQDGIPWMLLPLITLNVATPDYPECCYPWLPWMLLPPDYNAW